MPHFVFVTDDGEYIPTRKNTGQMYVSRVTLSPDISGARIFNTAGAARNAAGSGGFDGDVHHVNLSIGAKI